MSGGKRSCVSLYEGTLISDRTSSLRHLTLTSGNTSSNFPTLFGHFVNVFSEPCEVLFTTCVVSARLSCDWTFASMLSGSGSLCDRKALASC